jgi:hypothetical protein
MPRNVTLSLPEDLVRRAKVYAAERETSMSALVTSLLRELVESGMPDDRAWEAEEAVMAAGALRVGTVDWTRDDLHRR